MIRTKDKLMILLLMTAGFLGSLSQNLLTSALPSILTSFHMDAATGGWLTTSYILVLGIITAISAYVFYRFPTRLLVQTALSVFISGCILACFAHHFGFLLAARIIQALGAGILIPLLQIVVLYIFPREKQGQAFGLTGIIVGFAPAAGPVLSGILTDIWGWRGIFVFLIIPALITLIAGQFIIRDVGERKIQPLDFVSVCLYGIGFTLFMLAVTFMKNGSILQIKTILCMLTGIICLCIFVHRQNASHTPVLKLSLLTHRPLIVGTLLLCIAYILMMAGTILVPLYIQTICGYSATVSGLALLPGSLLIAIFSPAAGKAMDKYGARIPCITGMLCLTLGNGAFIFLTPDSQLLLTIIAYIVRSLGLAVLITVCSAYAVHALPLSDKPHGTAITNSLRQMSGSLFSTLLTSIATFCSHSDVLTMAGIRAAFAVMTALAFAGIIISVNTSARTGSGV